MSETPAAPPTEVPVRIVTVCCDPGIPEQVLTLYADDALDRNAESGDVAIILAEGPEYLTFRGAHVRWLSVRHAMGPSKAAVREALAREVTRATQQAARTR